MYRPFEVQRQLGIAKSTLARRTDHFGAWLSPATQLALTEDGTPALRLYEDRDVALLREIGALLDQGLKFHEVERMLERGEVQARVVVGDDDSTGEPAGPPGADRDPARAGRGPETAVAVAVTPHALLLGIEDLRTALLEERAVRQQQHQAALDAMARQTAALEAQTAASERLLAALEQAALPAPATAAVDPPALPFTPLPGPQPGLIALLRRRLGR